MNSIDMHDNFEWKLAKGSCGFNVGDAEVHGAYINGIALFAFKDPGSSDWFCCVVTGHMSYGGASLLQVQQAGARHAQDETERGDRKLTRSQFEDRMNSSERLPICVEAKHEGKAKPGPR